MVNYKNKYLKYKLKYKKIFNKLKGGAGLAVENDFEHRNLPLNSPEMRDEMTQVMNDDFQRLINDLQKYINGENDTTNFEYVIINIGAGTSFHNNPNECINEFIPEAYKNKRLLVLSININHQLTPVIIDNIKKNMTQPKSKMFKNTEIILPPSYGDKKQKIQTTFIEHYFTYFPNTYTDLDKNKEDVNRFIDVFIEFVQQFNDKIIIINNAIFNTNQHPLHISPFLLSQVIDKLYIPINVNLSPQDNDKVQIDFSYRCKDCKLLIKANYLLNERILNAIQHEIFDQENIDLRIAYYQNISYNLRNIERKDIRTLITDGTIIYSIPITSLGFHIN